MPNSHVTELQFNLPHMLHAKAKLGHLIYEFSREARSALKSGELSKEQHAALDEILTYIEDESKRLYHAAFNFDSKLVTDKPVISEAFSRLMREAWDKILAHVSSDSISRTLPPDMAKTLIEWRANMRSSLSKYVQRLSTETPPSEIEITPKGRKVKLGIGQNRQWRPAS